MNIKAINIKVMIDFLRSLERKQALALLAFFLLVLYLASRLAGVAFGICLSNSVDVKLYWYINNLNALTKEIEPNNYYMVRHVDNITQDNMLLKRIVCLPHNNITIKSEFSNIHTVQCTNNSYVYTFLPSNKVDKYNLHLLNGTVSTGDNYFVLGDNSFDSYDSRYKEFGFVNKTEILYQIHKIF